MTKVALFLLFKSISADLDLPPRLLDALCFVESSHRTQVINYADGHGGSLGICQIKLSTAKLVGFTGDTQTLLRPEINIKYAGLYLKKQIFRYNFDLFKAVAAYNSGRYIANKDGNPVNILYTDKVFSVWSKYLSMPTPIKQFTVIINGHKWTVKQYSNAQYENSISEGTLALTVYSHSRIKPVREILFSVSGSDRDTVAHEVLHAFLSYESFKKRYDIKNTKDRVEEIICESFGKNHPKINKVIEQIYKRLK